MSKFFDKLNSKSAVNAPEAYEGQLAGHITGGSGALRNKIVDSKLIEVSLPSINAGCGGIDIYTGGFSFISKDELINALKSIGSNAASYAFLLSMETISPQVSNVMKQLQTWANTINSLNINSCEMAAQLVGSVWPKQEATSQHICRTMGTKEGIFSDFVAARHGCREPDLQREVSANIQKNHPELLIENYNVAWEALKKQTLLQGNPSLSKLFMSLTGTIVVRNKQSDGQQMSEPEISVHPSKVFEQGFFMQLLNGGRLNGYTCVGQDKENKCLDVRTQDIEFSSTDAWLAKVQNILLSIQEKIFDDTPLNEQEKQLINNTHFPLYKVINVLSAYSKGRSPADLYQCATIIATDMMCRFIEEVLNAARTSAVALRSTQVDATMIDQFIKDLYRVESKVKELEAKNLSLFDQELKMLQKIELLEEKLRSQLNI